MSGRICAEALALVTWWGCVDRCAAVHSPSTGSIKLNTGCGPGRSSTSRPPSASASVRASASPIPFERPTRRSKIVLPSRYVGAFVGDIDDDRARALPHAQRHDTRAVVERVRQQHLQDLPHRRFGQRRRRDVRFDLDPHRPPDRGELAVPAVFGLVQQLGQVEWRTIGVGVAREREEVVHRRLEAVDRNQRVFERGAQVRTGCARARSRRARAAR